MALKGLQIACNPADFLTAAQLAGSKKLQNQYKELKEWAQDPTEISRQARSRFLLKIQQGLHDLFLIGYVHGDARSGLFDNFGKKTSLPVQQKYRLVDSKIFKGFGGYHTFRGLDVIQNEYGNIRTVQIVQTLLVC